VRVIVCGAGSAGCVVAARLSEDPGTSVLLLEGGPHYPEVQDMPDDVRDSWSFGGTVHDWGYASEDVLGAPRGAAAGFDTLAPGAETIYAYRGKVVGGSSAVNACLALRAPRQDFDQWVGLGNDRWSWPEVCEAFRRLEDDPIGGERHGVGGPVPVRRTPSQEYRKVFAAFNAAIVAAGCPAIDDLNGTDAIGVGPLPQNAVDRVRQSAYLTHLKAARERSNLELRAGVMIDRVELVDGVARSVVLADGERLEADLVVLCAGALSSPAILMRSGVGPADALGEAGVALVHRLDGVGQNLRDHPQVYPTFAVDESARDTGAPNQVGALFSTSGFPPGAPPELHVIPLMMSPELLIVSVSLIRPYACGRFAIRSADPADPPRIFFNALGHPEDLARIVAGVRFARELAAVEPLAGCLAGERWPGPDVQTDAALIDAVMQSRSTYAHATSTCSMGPAGAPWSVVDQMGKVHGLDGLYVIDASIFPAIPSVPTNITTMMVAERCAEQLRQDIGRRETAGAAAA
jgi:choline dehydrogenase